LFLYAVTTIKAQHQTSQAALGAKDSADLVHQFAELWGNCLMGFYR
jgi:hypothetical protein